MNFAVVLGQLCVDRRFREVFFRDGGKNAKAVLRNLPLPLTWAEREWLLHIAKKGGNSPGLKQDFDTLNKAIVAAGCPRGPCPIPYYYTLVPPPKNERDAREDPPKPR